MKRIHTRTVVWALGLGLLGIAVTTWLIRDTAEWDADMFLPNYPSVFLISRTRDVDAVEVRRLVGLLKERYVMKESDTFYAANIVIVDEGDRWAVSMHLPGNGDFRSRIPFLYDTKHFHFFDGRSVAYYAKGSLALQSPGEGDLVFAPLENDLELDANF